ncbi:uncharacterized protein LOC131093369 [Melospiza georgiana]|uniref:uncharacterized protein LOC131093369 n=1 Tax=Melospiza georgiana TaxID=44398 RepID=UPI0025AD49B8|nr:uncharacterized protein LOC131093369 [Melospiza georgiana]
MVAASEATRATMMRQWVEASLGLLEHLVAVCDEDTAFPWELQWQLKVTVASLEGTNETFPDVPEALVAHVAMAEQLWEANSFLAKDHLLKALDDIFKFYINERCQSIPKVSPVSVELQKVSPPQLQVLVAVVTALDEVVASVTGPHWGKFPDSLYEDLKNFTQNLCAILNKGDVTSLGHCGVPSLGQALATLWATPKTTRANMRAAASAWQELVAKLMDNGDWLAGESTKLCEQVVTAQQLMVAMDKEEVTLEMATHGAQVVAATIEAMGEAVVATRRGHCAEVALEPLQHLVAVCHRATLFNWNMECQLRDIEAILKGTNEVSPDVLKALMAKVAKFEQLWEASTRLAKDHLLEALGVIDKILLSPCGDHGGPSSAGSCTVAEQCQKAIEDIPRLLQESFT